MKLARVAPGGSQGHRPRLSVGRNLPGSYVSTWLNYRAFNPLSLAPTLWLDASDLGTITSSGGAVSQWDDKSGNAKHAVGSTSKPVTGSATIKGFNAIQFTAQFLTIPKPANAATTSLFFVVRTTDTPYVMFHDASGGVRYLLAGVSGDVSVAAIASNSGTPTYRRDGATASWTTRDGVYQGMHNRVSVVCIESFSTTAWGANFFIGGYTAAGFDLTADFGEVLAFGSNLATGDRDAVEAYLLAKWT